MSCSSITLLFYYLALCKMTMTWRHDACSSFLGTREKIPVWSESALPVTGKEGKGEGNKSIGPRTKYGHANLTLIWITDLFAGIYGILKTDRKKFFCEVSFFCGTFFGVFQHVGLFSDHHHISLNNLHSYALPQDKPSKCRRSGVLTRDSSSRRILKVGDLSQVKAE